MDDVDRGNLLALLPVVTGSQAERAIGDIEPLLIEDSVLDDLGADQHRSATDPWKRPNSLTVAIEESSVDQAMVPRVELEFLSRINTSIGHWPHRSNP